MRLRGFTLWSKTYDRDLGVMCWKLQTEIATAVAEALKVTLLGDDIWRKSSWGGTRQPGRLRCVSARGEGVCLTTRSRRPPSRDRRVHGSDPPGSTLCTCDGQPINRPSHGAAEAATPAAAREGFDKARTDAQRAVALTPDLAQAHLALATVLELGALDFTRASEEYERALALAPGNAQVLRISGLFAAYMGHIDAGLAAARRAVVLDPLARDSHALLGRALYAARRYEEAVVAFPQTASVLTPATRPSTPTAGSPTTGSGTCRAHALRASPTGTMQGINGAWQLRMKSSAGAPMRKPSFRN